jgi:hypothetical protein
MGRHASSAKSARFALNVSMRDVRCVGAGSKGRPILASAWRFRMPFAGWRLGA